MDHHEEPLDPQSWLDSIARLQARVMSDPAPSHYARHLRNAYTLSRLAPAVLYDMFAAEPDEAEYEKFLETGDLYKASIELLNPSLRLVLVKPDGTIKLEVHAASLGAVGKADADLPRGIVLAWTECIMQIAAQARNHDGELSYRAPHIHQSVPHPPSN